MRNFIRALLRNLLLLVGVPSVGLWISHAITRGGYNDYLFDTTSLFLYAVVAVVLTYLLHSEQLRE